MNMYYLGGDDDPDNEMMLPSEYDRRHSRSPERHRELRIQSEIHRSQKVSLESEIAAEIVASREEIKQAAIDKIVGQLVASTYETMGYEFQVRLDRALDEMVAKAAASIKAAKYRDHKTGEEISFEEKVKRTLLNFLGESAQSAPE